MIKDDGKIIDISKLIVKNADWIKEYENYIRGDSSVQRKISFITNKSEQFKGRTLDSLSEAEKKQLFDFAVYYYSEIDPEINEEMESVFSDRAPYILVMASDLFEEQWRNESRELDTKMNSQEKKESINLFMNICNMGRDCQVAFVVDELVSEVFVPKKPKRMLPEKKLDELMSMCKKIIYYRGFILGILFKLFSDQHFAIDVDQNGVWEYMTFEQLAGFFECEEEDINRDNFIQLEKRTI